MDLNKYFDRLTEKTQRSPARHDKPKGQTEHGVRHEPGNNILGISLGLHSTVVARFNDAGQPEVLPNRAGQDITPSVVQFLDSGEIVVGDEAKKLLGTDTDNVFGDFLRDIGTDKKWLVNGLTVTPTDLTAILLRQVIKECSEAYGKPTAVALSWPAIYRQDQRLAFIRAAEQAGIQAACYVSSPIAVAMAHAAKLPTKGKLLVYNFDDSTFGASVIEASAGKIEATFTGGVQQLGQKDIDDELMKLIAMKFRDKTGDDFDPYDCNFSKSNLEDANHSLSIREKTSIRVTSGTHGPVAMEITREEFEAAISQIVTQSEIACDGILTQAGLENPALAAVVMTGAGSAVPALQRSVVKLFGQDPILAHPKFATALGASICAAKTLSNDALTLAQQKSLAAAPSWVEIAPHYAGILVQDADGKTTNLNLIAKGTRLPCSAVHEFHIQQGQEYLNVSITESGMEETNPEFVNVLVSSFRKIGPNRGKTVRIKLEYDRNGVLSWSVLT